MLAKSFLNSAGKVVLKANGNMTVKSHSKHKF